MSAPVTSLPLQGDNHTSFSGVDRKRTVILLRSVVIASAAYLVLAGIEALAWDRVAYVAFFAASNVALALAPRRLFHKAHFGPLLLLADSAMILFGLSWSHGFSQDLLLVYFFTIFLITIGETLGKIAIGAALIVIGYGYWLWPGGGGQLAPDAWVRLPFFFLVGIFYASLIEQLKRERNRREEAELENRHLRFLLDLASVFSETHATREFVRGIGRFVEGMCPDLQCRMVLSDAPGGDAAKGATFPLRAHGQEYGRLRVGTSGRRELSERERWLCKMVSHAAAGALYAAEQSDAAKAAAESKEQFLATVSHEFRTPLHAILGYLDMLDSMVPSDADGTMRESIGRMRVNACRLQHLLEELLSFAEVRSGRRTVCAEAVSLQSLVGDLLPITRELVGEKPVEVRCEIGIEADEIKTDRRKLHRAMACLMSNAAKFTEVGGISVSGKRVGDGEVELTIADTGIGIAPGDLALIFDDFQQVDGSFTRRYGGLGIGLTLARELIDLLGGAMELASRVGEGTTVRVRLPRDAAVRIGVPGAARRPAASRMQPVAQLESWQRAAS